MTKKGVSLSKIKNASPDMYTFIAKSCDVIHRIRLMDDANPPFTKIVINFQVQLPRT